jgi:hypothetical protein
MAVTRPAAEPASSDAAMPASVVAAHSFSTARSKPAPRGFGYGTRLKFAAAALVALATGIALLVMQQQRGTSGTSNRGAPIAGVIQPTQPTVVATITAVAQPSWESPGVSPNELMGAGRTLALKSGCVELAFGGGARVVVEGPARLTLDSPAQMTLSDGKLAATCSRGGFTVCTHSATVVDLGTEFGVATSAAGTTEVEVFKGKVQATGRSGAAKRQQAYSLIEGQAAMVSADAVTLEPGGAVPQHFVRSLSTAARALDVVDLVAGGDGTTHRRGLGIDPLTGDVTTGRGVGDFVGDRKYHRVTPLPVVDGCFVPNGRSGPVQVDSNGDRFAFPVTSGMSFDRIWTGGPIPTSGRTISTTLRGIDYAKPDHALLFIHSNTGLTLDLAAIRRLHPELLLLSFHCTVGNSFVPSQKGDNVEPRADAFLLVDGKPRFQRTGFSNKDRPFLIDVPLRAADRFLTLATTDWKDHTKFDWVLWTDPMIESRLEPNH